VIVSATEAWNVTLILRITYFINGIT